MISPSYGYNFSIPEISETLKGSPTKNFRTLRQKIINRYSCQPPLSLIHKIFWWQKLLKHITVSLRCFSVPWDKNFWQNFVIYPSYAWKFSIPKTFWNPEGFLNEKFRYRETKNNRWKIITPPPPPAAHIHENSDTGTFSKHRSVRLRNVSVLWNNPNSTENWDFPSFILTIFRYRKLFETPKGSTTKNFGTVRQKTFVKKLCNPPPSLIHKIFWYQNFSETQKRFFYEFFRHSETKKYGKSWSYLYCIKYRNQRWNWIM